jgi:type II secretory pathway component GspD/PulD (secretin)
VRSKEDTPGPDAQDAKDAAQSASTVAADAGQTAATDEAQPDSSLLAMAPAGSSAASSSNADLGSADISKLMEDTTRMAREGLANENSQADATLAPAVAPKPAADFYSPFRSDMQPVSSNGMQVNNAMPVSGKDALNGVRIDKYEIMDQPLDKALTLLVAPTGFNVIVDSAVGTDHNVTLSFKDRNIDLRSALDLLTKSYGLDYVVQSGTIVVGSKQRLYTDLMSYETRLFVLSYASPRSVKQMLLQTGLVGKDQVEVYNEKVISGAGGGGGGGVSAGGAAGGSDQSSMDMGSGTSGTSGSSSMSSMTGGNTSSPTAAGGETDPSVSTTPQNSLLVKATPEDMDRIAAVIKNIDRRPQLVEMEVRVCEANDNALRDLGLELNGATGPRPLNANDLTSNLPNNGIAQIWSEAPQTVPGQNSDVFESFSIGSFLRSGLSFSAALSHEIQTGNVHILAQPTLTTAEGKAATYFAGDHVPYISQPANNTGGSSQAAQVDYIDVGIKLNFTPRIDADGMVTVDVSPQVSSLVGFIALDNNGSKAPQTTTRELHTRVRVGSCEPFVLAGMISDRESEAVSKIPGLSNLPWVGHLFRHTTKNKSRTEIIIVVVPKVKD